MIFFLNETYKVSQSYGFDRSRFTNILRIDGCLHHVLKKMLDEWLSFKTYLNMLERDLSREGFLWERDDCCGDPLTILSGTLSSVNQCFKAVSKRNRRSRSCFNIILFSMHDRTYVDAHVHISARCADSFGFLVSQFATTLDLTISACPAMDPLAALRNIIVLY